MSMFTYILRYVMNNDSVEHPRHVFDHWGSVCQRSVRLAGLCISVHDWCLSAYKRHGECGNLEYSRCKQEELVSQIWRPVMIDLLTHSLTLLTVRLRLACALLSIAPALS